jgi:sialate O-acetylesterase
VRLGWLAPVLLLSLGTTFPARASSLRLPSLIGDHMVLQQGRPVVVWGWDAPGQTVEVTLAGHRSTARSDGDGRFRVELPAMKAGGPYEMTLAGSAHVIIRDVLAGEVWVGSGQSNMHYAFARSHAAAEETPHADQPEIRFFQVETRETAAPAEDVVGSWVVATPRSVQPFSAVAWYFGSMIHRELKVPVGLVVSCWPGTSGESWTPRRLLETDSALRSIADEWDARPPEKRHVLDGPHSFELEFGDLHLVPGHSSTPPGLVAVGDSEPPPGARLLGGPCTSSVPGASVEAIHPGPGGPATAARFAGYVKPGESAWAECPLGFGQRASDLSAFRAVEVTARGSDRFTLMVEQPTIVDWDRYSSSPLSATAGWQRFRIELDELRQAGWGVARPFTPEVIQSLMLEVEPPASSPALPGGLFNAMIAPLTPYGIRGVIWYQGEGNAGRPSQYRHLLPALIRGWREAWDLGAFPFLVVQLPNYRAVRDEPGDSDWARLREAQRLTVESVPGTGLAVTIDLGEAADVHPPNKRDVGRRLARWALGTTYGRELVYSGPLFEEMVREGHRIRLRFRHVGGGLVARGGELRGFAVAGEDRRFHWARAAIEGDGVSVWSDQVETPVAVRYGWADNPVASLYNAEGLPASPFRTDAW